MKNVLYFSHVNPLERDAGCKVRVLSILTYLKQRGYHVDFAGMVGWGSNWTSEQSKELVHSGLAQSFTLIERKPPRSNPLKYLFHHKVPVAMDALLHRKSTLSNLATPYVKARFNELLRQKKYDYIVVNYAYFSALIDKNPLVGSAITIVDTHDFLTPHESANKRHSFGTIFSDEISRLDSFDQVWAISSDEYYVFRQFLGQKVKLVPMMLDVPAISTQVAPKWDLLYVASDNPANVESANWFFKEVYPSLPAALKTCVIGKITNHVPKNLSGITKISFAVELSDYYLTSRLVLCPMLSGTGTKIKVVEALSYGCPVVCSERGVDGFSNKSGNGCFVANSASAFINTIDLLLSNPEILSKAREEALSCFHEFFSTSAGYLRLDSILGQKSH